MDMPCIRSVEEIAYEKRLARLFLKLRAYGFTLTAADFELWCESDHVRKEFFTSNLENWALDIDFEIRLRQRIAGNLFCLRLGATTKFLWYRRSAAVLFT